MHHLSALLMITAWFAIMIYGWSANRKGEFDGLNYSGYSGSRWLRWLLGGQSREKFMRQHRTVHRLMLPFAVAFYLLAMWGILSTP